jgi:hypothetical protein
MGAPASAGDDRITRGGVNDGNRVVGAVGDVNGIGCLVECDPNATVSGWYGDGSPLASDVDAGIAQRSVDHGHAAVVGDVDAAGAVVDNDPERACTTSTVGVAGRGANSVGGPLPVWTAACALVNGDISRVAATAAKTRPGRPSLRTGLCFGVTVTVLMRIDLP